MQSKGDIDGFCTPNVQELPLNSSFIASLRSVGECQTEFEAENNSSGNTNTGSDESKIILCVLWQSGYLGAAYYSYPESELHILSDSLDLKPEYIMMKTLYNQIKPSHTITLGTKPSKFVAALCHIAAKVDFEDCDLATEPEEPILGLPFNIELLKRDKYSFDLSLHAVENLKLSCEPPDCSDEERHIFIRSILNFGKRLSIHALGALLIFLNNNYNFIAQGRALTNHLYLNISPISLKNIVLMNDDIIEGLQIFNLQTRHLDRGISIFKLFNRCKSGVGTSFLRSMLLRPTNNLNVLKRRHAFIEFCLKPINQGIVVGIEDCLKNISFIGGTLNKIYQNLDGVKRWKQLYTTLHNIAYFKEICKPYTEEIQIFKDYVVEVGDTVEFLRKSIADVIDFENSTQLKVAVKMGVDKMLDKKKRHRNEIKEKLNIAVNFEINNLPNYVKECSLAYIPQVGYSVVVRIWSSDAKYQDLEKYGYRHLFTLEDTFHFKSAVCDELDKSLGDIFIEIEKLETKIVNDLSNIMMANSSVLKKLTKHIAEIDSLICFAQVAKYQNYVCPNLTRKNVIEIYDGRHPLLEMNNFIPNSCLSGGDQPVVKIITGPNNSGKSIYLRQTILIVYLAHIGSYVPAKSANIGMMYSLHSIISDVSNNEISSNMSSFLMSLRQMSQASNIACKNSLLIIDEFGRSTSEFDGLALLTSFIEHDLLREELCPHILVSTHYLRLVNLIPESKFVEHLKFDFKLIHDDEALVFLYKLVKGVSKSYAKFTAINSGIPMDIVKRSEYIMKCYREGIIVKPLRNE